MCNGYTTVALREPAPVVEAVAEDLTVRLLKGAVAEREGGGEVVMP